MSIEPNSSHEANSAQNPLVSNKQLTFIVYVLYLVALITGGLSAVIGVIIAYIKIGEADEVTRTHYQFQIRTFWIGLIYIIIGAALTMVFIGIVVLIFAFVWWLVRSVKGLLLLNDNKPIAQPQSWMFG